MLKSTILSVLVALFVMSCNSDSTSSDNNNNNNGTMKGTMSAKVNNANWSANILVSGSNQSGMVGITGDQVSGGVDQKIQFTVVGATGPGTITLGGFNPSSAVYISVPQGTTDQSVLIGATETSSSGSITFTTLTSTKAVGTFSFTTTKGTSVTNGQFDVTF